eukprot:1186603-Prorocentrum_minimum.AAC.3
MPVVTKFCVVSLRAGLELYEVLRHSLEVSRSTEVRASNIGLSKWRMSVYNHLSLPPRSRREGDPSGGGLQDAGPLAGQLGGPAPHTLVLLSDILYHAGTAMQKPRSRPSRRRPGHH